jgi:RNA polymerase sigma-70 factor, ECF subfamily
VTDGEGSSEAGRLDPARLDPAEVEALYACHAAELRVYLTGLLRDPELAADVLQATFLRVVELGHTASRDSARAWLFRVAHNEAIDRRRRQVAEGKSLNQSAWWKRKRPADPEELFSQEETIARVRQAIERLPIEQQCVVQQRIYDGLTFAEIASKSGLPLGTVLTRMRIATRRLADALRGEVKHD